MSHSEREEHLRRLQLEYLVEPVRKLSVAGGRRLGDRKFHNSPYLQQDEQEREIYIESPKADAWYKIREGVKRGRSLRTIERLTCPYEPDKTRWYFNILPDSVVEDARDVETWENTSFLEIRRMKDDVENGREIANQLGIRKFYEAVQKALINFPQDKAS